MLKLKDMIENYDLVREAVQNWPHDEDGLNEAIECFRISSNAIHMYYHNGQECYLRLAPVGDKCLLNLLGEVEFINYLRGKGYPALEPIVSKGGEWVLTLNTQWGSYYAMAFKGVDGEPIEDSDFSNEVCLEYGKTLGELHKLSMDYQPKIKKQTYKDIMEVIKNRLTAFDCPGELMSIAESIEQQLDALSKDREHFGLVHYDFECDNVFFDPKTNSCHVIDFDDSIYHFYALDVEQAIDSIYSEADEGVAEAAANAFLQGYNSVLSFDEQAQSLRPLMRKFCDLYSYTKIIYCLSERVEPQLDWMPPLIDKLLNKARYLESKLIAKQ